MLYDIIIIIIARAVFSILSQNIFARILKKKKIIIKNKTLTYNKNLFLNKININRREVCHG